MYSILILGSNSKYSYYLNADGTVYTTDSLEVVGNKIVELLATYTLSQLSVIKNCVITSTITVEEVTA